MGTRVMAFLKGPILLAIFCITLSLALSDNLFEALEKKFVLPYYLFTQDKKTENEGIPKICKVAKDMIKIGKRKEESLKSRKRQVSCVASLLGSTEILEQLQGMCKEEHEDCIEEREGLAGDIMGALNACYDAEAEGRVMQASPLVYRVI